MITLGVRDLEVSVRFYQRGSLSAEDGFTARVGVLYSNGS